MNNTIIGQFWKIHDLILVMFSPNRFCIRRKKINKYLKDLVFTFHNVCACDMGTIINKSNKPICS